MVSLSDKLAAINAAEKAEKPNANTATRLNVVKAESKTEPKAEPKTEPNPEPKTEPKNETPSNDGGNNEMPTNDGDNEHESEG